MAVSWRALGDDCYLALMDNATQQHRLEQALLQEVERARDTEKQLTQLVHLLEAEKKRSEKLAKTDDLTQLYNRRQLYLSFNQLIKQACTLQCPLTLALLDLDNFKEINDRYGHQTGYLVLQHFADFLRENLRKHDVVGRFGGEEFVVVSLGTSAREMQQVLQRLLAKWQSRPLILTRRRITVTFSGGIASVNDPSRKAVTDIKDLLFQKADQAMYLAKNKGKAQFRVDPHSTREHSEKH